MSSSNAQSLVKIYNFECAFDAVIGGAIRISVLSGMKKEFEQHRISETFGRETEDSFG
jgi:predicted nucleotide-binding protein (sugar kinase/HSP70/actin superfamily)